MNLHRHVCVGAGGGGGVCEKEGERERESLSHMGKRLGAPQKPSDSTG